MTESADDAAVLRGDRFATITPAMWRLMMDGKVILRNDEPGVWYAASPPPAPALAQAVLAIARSGRSGRSDRVAAASLADPLACISCGDRSSPLQPSGECDSCLSDRLSGEFSE